MFLIVVAIVNCYRATTQSITVDEAFAYQRFVSQPFRTSLKTFDAAHHVLHTFACIFFVRVFGAGPVPLRLTSLLFGFVYLWAVWRLSVRLFPSNWLVLLAAVLLALNPYVFDFMSAARGYGMALALFAWAVVLLFQFGDELFLSGQPARWTITWLAVLATLAVGANLTFAFPAVTLLAAVTILVYRSAGSVRSIARDIVIPAALTTCLFARPLVVAKHDDFYFGAPSLRVTLQSLYAASFDPDWSPMGFSSDAWAQLQNYLPYLLTYLGIVAILAIARLWKRGKEKNTHSPQRLVLGVMASVLFGSVLLTLIGHRVTHMPYPYARTCLYAIFLCSLMVLLADAQFVRAGQPWRTAAYAVTVILILIGGLYCLEFRTQWYGDWKFDASTDKMMRSLGALPRNSSTTSVHLGTYFAMETTANFYRELYHYDWLAPVTRDPLSCKDDYLLVRSLDRPIVDELGFKVLKQDSLSGAILAQRTAESCAVK